VADCRIWNAHGSGAAKRLRDSGREIPGFIGRGNVLFRQEHAFWFYHSPSVSSPTTRVANLYSAAAFLYSCEKSICRNNSFTFQGNDVMVIEETLGGKTRLKTFECDYNNYGTALRGQPLGAKFNSLTPRKSEGFLSGGSKAIVNYSEYTGQGRRYVSLDEWRAFSGLDHVRSSPIRYADSLNRDFRLDPKSPNIRHRQGDNRRLEGQAQDWNPLHEPRSWHHPASHRRP
jgi:hypothetical protein